MSKKDSLQIEDFQKKIEIAQEAVSKITDDSLKTVAFQTILQKLLNSGTVGFESEQNPEPPKLPKEENKTPKAKQPKGPKGRIEELIDEGFFKQKRTIGDVKKELEAHTWFHRVEELNPSLTRLIQDKKLRRIKEPESEGGKLIWRYSNW